VSRHGTEVRWAARHLPARQPVRVRSSQHQSPRSWPCRTVGVSEGSTTTTDAASRLAEFTSSRQHVTSARLRLPDSADRRRHGVAARPAPAPTRSGGRYDVRTDPRGSTPSGGSVCSNLTTDGHQVQQAGSRPADLGMVRYGRAALARCMASQASRTISTMSECTGFHSSLARIRAGLATSR